MTVDYFDLITKTVMWILGIIVVYMLIVKILGHSPTTEAIVLSLMGIFGMGLLHLYYHYGQFNNFTKETFPRFEKNIKESFARVKEDLEEIKRKMK